MASNEECFLICPIGDSNSEDRKRSDMLMKHVLEPICKDAGYTLVRADMMPKSGIITSQVLNMVIDSPLVIADLTNSNPNVYYELALRHAIEKPYMQLIEHSQKIPFDVSTLRTTHYNLNDLDEVEKTKEEVRKQINAIKKGHLPDSPISIAKKSELLNIHDNTLAVFLEKFWNIEEGVLQIQDQIDSVEKYQENEIRNLIEDAVEDKIRDVEDTLNEILNEIKGLQNNT